MLVAFWKAFFHAMKQVTSVNNNIDRNPLIHYIYPNNLYVLCGTKIHKFQTKFTTIWLYLQQSSNPKDTRETTPNGIDTHVLDLDCLTELYITRLNDQRSPSTVTYCVETKLLKQVHDILFSSQQRQQSQADEEYCRNSWMMVAMVIDRLLLLVFTLLTIVTSSVLLLNRPTYGYIDTSQQLDTLDWSWLSYWHWVISCYMMECAVMCRYMFWCVQLIYV